MFAPRFRRVRRIARRQQRAPYESQYFGEGRNPLGRMGLSGYERYARDTSNADIAAYLMWRFFRPARSLDVGCATGFVVEALRELNVNAFGTDVSEWAIAHGAAGAKGRLRVGNLLTRLPYRAAQFDLVTALETLEHLPPESVSTAIAELARVSRGWVVVTIPSIGANDHGPDGFPNAKVLDERLPHYLSLGRDYSGPIPFADLMVDVRGEPIEGHLTIASFSWWTARCAEAGLERCGWLEEMIHPVLARFGLTEFWNLYVFRVGSVPPTLELPGVDEIKTVERRWKLADRTAPPRSLEFLRAGLGDDAVRAALNDLR